MSSDNSLSDNPLRDIRIGSVTAAWAKGNQIEHDFSASLESTNTKAKAEAFSEKSFEHGLILYLTDHQTAGRGRGKNIWIDSKPGSALLSSWSFQLDSAPSPTVSCLMGLALYKAAAATWSFLNWSLKAPNDLYIDDKKVAGLLLETVSQGSDVRMIVGLGMNILANPDGLPTATSLVKKLPTGAPLLGEDYLSFLDRLLFEMSVAVSMNQEPLNSTVRANLLFALNQFTLLEEKYLDIDAKGNLKTESRKISWSEL